MKRSFEEKKCETILFFMMKKKTTFLADRYITGTCPVAIQMHMVFNVKIAVLH